MTQHHEHHHGPDAHDSAALAELLDLDGEVLHDYLSEAMVLLHRQVAGSPRRIVDLGAGTGVGTVALAQCFETAEVIAVDVSEQMLGHVNTKAAGLGLTDRVRTLEADVNAVWPAIDEVDIVWASNSLHEMGDHDRVFNDIAAALRPGGVLAVAEMDSHPRFLPDDIGLGRPGLESRWRAALEASAETRSPLGPDWGPHLARAGFTDVTVRRFDIDLQPPHATPVGRYAQAYVRMIRPRLEAMDADDLATIDTLLDSDGPHGFLHRSDLTVRNIRTVWLARLSEPRA